MLKETLTSGKTFGLEKIKGYLYNNEDADRREPSYYLPIMDEIRKIYEEKFGKTDKHTEKKFIFIIDEINRGEISKIFGELFYSIDPGYRGKAGEISTQYANMHDDPDEKFYIPENVYIIGTMNDIDRSVDTFDFAMRRRFRFVEVTAKASQDMLEDPDLGLESGKIDEAKNRMDNLNAAIIAPDTGLNKNYQIGASYFLKLKELNGDFNALWSDYLEPLLQDYIRGMEDERKIMDSLEEAYKDVSNHSKSGKKSEGGNSVVPASNAAQLLTDALDEEEPDGSVEEEDEYEEEEDD